MSIKSRTVRKACLVVAVAACLCISVASAAAHAQAATANSCADVVVLDSRGSDESGGELSSPGKVFAAALRTNLSDQRVVVIANPYPAAGGLWGMFGAYLKVAFVGKYHDSVEEGKRWLSEQIALFDESCPNMRIILTGYSQGAQVAGDVYQDNATDNVQGTVLFGDPYFNPANGEMNEHSFSFTNHGRLGERPELDGDMAKHFLSFCHKDDPVCQNLSLFRTLWVGFGQHENYTDLGEPEAAAAYFTWLIVKDDEIGAEPLPNEPQNKWPTEKSNGPAEFYIWLGASLIVSDWESCSSNYCIIGVGNAVGLFQLDDIKELGGDIPIDTKDPRAELAKRGVPDKEIDVLLSP